MAEIMVDIFSQLGTFSPFLIPKRINNPRLLLEM
jgi:hypothetical protein